MGNKREELQSLLESIMAQDNADPENVYFQPPNGYKLTYPCIIYERDYLHYRSADSVTYLVNKRYNITCIYEDPDSGLPDALSKIPGILFNRHFIADNLYHDVFTLYY